MQMNNNGIVTEPQRRKTKTNFLVRGIFVFVSIIQCFKHRGHGTGHGIQSAAPYS